MTNWLDYFRQQRRKLDIEKPVEVGDPMNDLRTPLPQSPSPINKLRWKIYNTNQRSRDILTRERHG